MSCGESIAIISICLAETFQNMKTLKNLQQFYKPIICVRLIHIEVLMVWRVIKRNENRFIFIYVNVFRQSDKLKKRFGTLLDVNICKLRFDAQFYFIVLLNGMCVQKIMSINVYAFVTFAIQCCSYYHVVCVARVSRLTYRQSDTTRPSIFVADNVCQNIHASNVYCIIPSFSHSKKNKVIVYALLSA